MESKSQKVKKAFKFTLLARDTQKVFDPELGPGVLATQEVEFDIEPDRYGSPQFVSQLLTMEREFVDGLIEVKIEEIKNG